MDAVAHIQYRTPKGEPYLYAIALYDHHEYRFFADGLSGMDEWQAEPRHDSGRRTKGDVCHAKSVVQKSETPNEPTIVARLTLTSSQLVVECDSRDRLNDVKHRLAGVFGFALHFRRETLTPPHRRVTLEELQSEQPVR